MRLRVDRRVVHPTSTVIISLDQDTSLQLFYYISVIPSRNSRESHRGSQVKAESRSNSLGTKIRKLDAVRHHAIRPLQNTPFVFPMCHASSSAHLSLLESSWESSDVVGELALVGQELDIGTVDQKLSLSLLLHVLFTTERSEAPVLGNDDLLAARELVL